ncbi:hypothetical protein EWM64_g1112 [Hericium alpestre]|uniref:Protein kinase domain-containing protein n=1 Tax=Hericium alpestre TaxID=135208 RepID=A0A4Z0A9C5_9AGAM|nr:hypothetical protein EWM64_g1112 [Hericium alpestre]
MAGILDEYLPENALVQVAPLEPDWHPILHVSNQVVLYNPTSHALAIHEKSSSPHSPRLCPYCSRPLPADADDSEDVHDYDAFEDGARRAANYFQLLQVANESASRPSSPPMLGDEGMSSGSSRGSNAFRPENMAEGYFAAFFQEEARLGHFAVKKIAVGDSRSYLLKILREHAAPEERERIREQLGMSSGSNVSRNKADWKAVHLLSAEEVKSLFSDVVEGLGFLHDKSILHLDLKPGNVLLTWDEGRLIPRAMLSDFGTSRDMVNNSRDRSGNTGTLEYTSPESLRSPSTGLLQQIDSKSDMWSLGMVLHKLLFFRLPYRWAAYGDRDETLQGKDKAGGGIPGGTELDRLEREVLAYKGFKSNVELENVFASRRLPRSFLILLEGLLNVLPASRPSCERVLVALHNGKFDPVSVTSRAADPGTSSLLGPLSRRTAQRAASPVHARMVLPTRTSPQLDTQPERQPGGVSGLSEVEHELSPEPSEKSEAAMRLWEEERALLFGPPPPGRGNGHSWGGHWSRVATWGALVLGTVGVNVARPNALRTGKFGKPPVGRPSMVRKLLKSCVLVAKISSLSYVRFDTHLRPIILGMLFVLAVADTLFDSLRLSAVLALAHIAILKLTATIET